MKPANTNANCIVCNSDIQDAADSKTKDSEKNLFKMWPVFCETLQVTNYSDYDDILSYFCSINNVPFCQSCHKVVTQLYKLDEKNKQIQNKINQVKSSLKNKILETSSNTIGGEPDSQNSIQSTKKTRKSSYSRDPGDSINERIVSLRDKIAKYYMTTDDDNDDHVFKAEDKNSPGFLPSLITSKTTTSYPSTGDSQSRPRRKISTRHFHKDNYYYGEGMQIDDNDNCDGPVYSGNRAPPPAIKSNSKKSGNSSDEFDGGSGLKPRDKRQQKAWKQCIDENGQKSFLFNGKWSVSIVKVSNGIRFCCDVKGCNARRRRKSDMTAHIKLRHIDTSRYTCNLCNLQCHNMSHLKWHKATHNTVRAFACLEEGCGRSYKAQIHLSQHHRIAHKNRKGVGTSIAKTTKGQEQEKEKGNKAKRIKVKRKINNMVVKELSEGEELDDDDEQEEPMKPAQLSIISSSSLASHLLGQYESKKAKKMNNNVIIQLEEDEDEYMMEFDDGINDIDLEGRPPTPELDWIVPQQQIVEEEEEEEYNEDQINGSVASALGNDCTPAGVRHREWKRIVNEKGQEAYLYDDKWLVSYTSGTKGEFQFFCESCGARRRRKSDMTAHIRLTHINPLRYACRYCGKLCHHSGHLKWHEATHSNETPFVCKEGCGRSYKSKVHLVSHLRTAHGIRVKGQINSAGGSQGSSASSSSFSVLDQLPHNEDGPEPYEDEGDEEEKAVENNNNVNEERELKLSEY